MMGRDLILDTGGRALTEYLNFCNLLKAGVSAFTGSSGRLVATPQGPPDDWREAPLAGANLVSSERRDGMHIPVLDLDMNAMLIPSSTTGHYHLYIDKPMSWEQYQRLLDVMAEVGILEPGYVEVSKKRRKTQVRTPWTRK